MQKVCLTVLLWIVTCIALTEGKTVTAQMESEMSVAIKNLLITTVDSDGLRFLVPGIIRLCFHDCVHICDGCIDTRRKVQGGNNGLEPTWKPLKFLWQRRFSEYCSRADFFALACKVTADYSGERGEEEGTCTKSNTIPGGQNDCRPNMKVLWGRRTCEIPQSVEPKRELPDANQDPYEWFDEHMKMTPREAVCLMGSHTLGKLRANETGFSGDYTTHLDVLSNEFFKMMLEPSTQWTQKLKRPVVDDFPEKRQQWEDPTGNFSRVNSDMMLMYNLGKLDKDGKSRCIVPPRSPRRRNEHQCRLSPHIQIVVEMANDNKVFIECFGDAMDKMVHNGYRVGELVETGVEIPIVTTTLPPPTTRRVLTKAERRRLRRERNQLRRGGRRRNGGRTGGRRNRQRGSTTTQRPSGIAHLSRLVLNGS